MAWSAAGGLDLEAAKRAIAEAKAKGEKTIPWKTVKNNRGLWPVETPTGSRPRPGVNSPRYGAGGGSAPRRRSVSMLRSEILSASG